MTEAAVEEKSAKHFLYFGVGCFHFIPLAQTATTLTWSQVVQQQLGGIAALDELELKVLSEDLATGSTREPAAGWLSFKVRIPDRMRNEIDASVKLLENEFRVFEVLSAHGPVTFVSYPLEGIGQGLEDGRESVRIVGEFLRKELQQRKDSQLEIKLTTPSPFRGEFTVVHEPGRIEGQKESDSASFNIDRIDGLVPQFFITVRGGASESEFQGILAGVFEELASELAVYYEISRFRHRAQESADQIFDLAKDLAAQHAASGFKAMLGRVFRSGRQAREITLRVIIEVAEGATFLRMIKNSLGALRAKPSGLWFEQELAQHSEGLPGPQLTAAQSIAEALEGSRRKEFEVAVLSAATMLGALAGAVASIIVR